MTDFVNRRRELSELDALAEGGGLVVVHGRRRVGKSRLLTHWLAKHGGRYAQAIEGPPEMQIEQLRRDLQGDASTEMVPRTWVEFFELLRLEGGGGVVCIDEFPYLVLADRTLPSVVQRFVDHKMPKGMMLVLSGSSMRMMHDTFLHRAAPLFGRAKKLLPVRPMSYLAFAAAVGNRPTARATFEQFALVGGIPKYWEFVRPRASAVQLAESLFFGFAPYFSDEPARLLKDEAIHGQNPLSVLEAIGRGATKPSEIAARVGTAQNNLTRVLEALVEASLLEREIPFGESLRSTKRVLYRIADPALRFHFHVYSPHRTRWSRYGEAEKRELVTGHVGPVFEHWIRSAHPESARYWERDRAGTIEFDAVRLETSRGKTRAIVTEVKWAELSAVEKIRIEERITLRWNASALAKKHGACEVEVVDSTLLKDAAAVKRLGAER